jgi:osmotically-inducible protein OsmY
MSLHSTLAVAVVVVLTLGTASAGQRTSADVPRGDQTEAQLIRNIQRQVLQYPHYTVFDSVKMRINEGAVTLFGKVTMPYKRDELEKRVASVPGVVKVDNQITVLPASKSDDELRVGIAQAIYRHPSFDRFAGFPNPPVHVIVDRGYVTLEGHVDTQADRLAALSIARSFGSFQVTDELVVGGGKDKSENKGKSEK